MKVNIQTTNKKVFDLILKTVNATLSLWHQQPQFSCRAVVKGNDIQLIGYGKNADKDAWRKGFANAVISYLKQKYDIKATIAEEEIIFIYDEKETNSVSSAKKSNGRKKKSKD